MLVKALKKKIRRITMHIMESQYGVVNELVHYDEVDPETWNQIELTTCGKYGPIGPTLEDCIKTYKADWFQDKRLFDVSPDRPGIQNVTILKTGKYKITARGAGNMEKTGSGTVFFRL